MLFPAVANWNSCMQWGVSLPGCQDQKTKLQWDKMSQITDNEDSEEKQVNMFVLPLNAVLSPDDRNSFLFPEVNKVESQNFITTNRYIHIFYKLWGNATGQRIWGISQDVAALPLKWSIEEKLTQESLLKASKPQLASCPAVAQILDEVPSGSEPLLNTNPRGSIC